MIKDIYKVIIASGFTSKGQDVVNNKRLGIKRTFTDSVGRYIEIYTETYGFSLFIYGTGFMHGNLPWRCDIIFKKDVEHLRTKIKTTIGVLVRYSDGNDYSHLKVNSEEHPEHSECVFCGSTKVTITEKADICHEPDCRYVYS